MLTGQGLEGDLMDRKLIAAALSAVLVLSTGMPASQAQARVPAAVMEQARVSMLIKGMLDISAQGRVEAIAIDDAQAYESALLDGVRQQIAQWEFEPIQHDGQPVPFRTPMTLRLVGQRDAGDGMKVHIASSSFQRLDRADSSEVRMVEGGMKPPRYPRQAFMAGYTGNVYLLLQVDRSGAVVQAAADRVDLTRAGRENEMERARHLLEQASVQAARQWKFQVPTSGENAQAEHWQLRVPVRFTFGEDVPADKPGHWQPYIPGPRQHIEWAADRGRGYNSALAASQIQMVDGSGPVLKTPLGG